METSGCQDYFKLKIAQDSKWYAYLDPMPLPCSPYITAGAEHAERLDFFEESPSAIFASGEC